MLVREIANAIAMPNTAAPNIFMYEVVFVSK